MLVADAPLAIDNEGLRDAIDAPIDADPAVIGADPRIRVAERRDPRHRGILFVLVVDAVDRHALGRGERLQYGMLGAARRASRREGVDEADMPLQIG